MNGELRQALVNLKKSIRDRRHAQTDLDGTTISLYKAGRDVRAAERALAAKWLALDDAEKIDILNDALTMDE